MTTTRAGQARQFVYPVSPGQAALKQHLGFYDLHVLLPQGYGFFHHATLNSWCCRVDFLS